MRRFASWWLATSLLWLACSGEEAVVPAQGEVVSPPFEVSGDASGLLLVWIDEEGSHTATSRDEIPESRREMVRVDDLSLRPADRLDPGLVYVADLRAAGEDGQYVVRRVPRDTFEARAGELGGADEEPVAVADSESGDGDVVLYGASWCSACRGAAAYLRENRVDFVERDIEREPGARQAMQQAAARAGVRPTGIPVIDFDGQVITGFDRGALSRAIAARNAI